MIKLFPYQLEGVEFLMSHHFALLGDQMGLGKTAQAIEVANRTELSTLVICPAFLKGTWEREIEKFSKNPKQFTITSYSRLKHLEKDFKKYALVICDEIHYLKNMKAQRTCHIHRYMKTNPPERFIGLSGTAIKNRVSEFYSLIKLMDYSTRNTSGINMAKIFPDFWKFSGHFSFRIKKNFGGQTVITYEGLQNVDHLKKLLKNKYLRRRTQDVLDLPPITRKTVMVKGANSEILKEVWKKIKEGKDISSFSAAKKESANCKTDFTIKYAKDLLDAGEDPLIIFTDHIESAKKIAEHLGEVAITGGTPVSRRDKMVQAFQAGKIKVLVATTGSLSVGVTLTRSRNIIFNDLPWVPGDLAQAEARIWRISQKRNCVVHAIAWGSIDAHIIETLTKKVDVINKVL